MDTDLALEPTPLLAPPAGAPVALAPPPPGATSAPLAAPVAASAPPAQPPGLPPIAPLAAPTLPTLPTTGTPAPSPPVPATPVAHDEVLPTLAAPTPTATAPPQAVPIPAPDLDASPTHPPQQASFIRRRGPMLIGVALLIGAAVLAYSALTGSSDDAIEQQPREPAEDVEPASPILVPINDAQNAVDQINDRPGETELLDQLGLDPTGSPIAPGYQFIATDTAGVSFAVQVDTTTGNYSMEATSGLGYRSIDGATVTRPSATEPWTPIDMAAVIAVQGFGLEALVTEADIVTTSVNPWTTIESQETVDGVETTIYRLDVASMNAEQPINLAEWAATFGLEPASLISAASAPVEITIVVDAQRTVREFRISGLTDRTSVNYVLDTVFDTAPTISL